MRVQVVDNSSKRLISVLLPVIEQSEDIRIAVAFVSRSGLRLMHDAIEAVLQSGGQLEFLIGLDLHTTEPDALRELYELSRANERLDLYCYSKIEEHGIYHPKLYLLRSGDKATCVIGSSNLTAGGLKTNIEINAVLEGEITDDPVSDSYSAYNRLKFHQQRVIPDEELLDRYKNVQRTQRKATARSDAEYKEAVARFNEKAKSLKSPKPTSKDLVGWPGLVYNVLPKDVFTNEDIYAHEAAFRSRYPGNKHIRAKIRQQLQILRDMNLIEHVSEGYWRKR